jgi:Mce-associated membrane protein
LSSSADTIARRRIAGERRRPTEGAATSTRSVNATAAPDFRRPEPSRAATPPSAEADPAPRHSTSSWRWPLVALVVAALALATVLGLTLRGPAVASGDETAAVASAKTGLEQILSFDAKSVARKPDEVAGLLTGSFKDEFRRTFTANIAPLATKNGAVVRAQVREIGVASHTDDTVVVQAFVNQTRTTAADSTPATDQNRVIATMTRVDGRWLISKLSAY